MRTEFVEANGIRFHLETDGQGPLVILLHGFPQTSYMWRGVMPGLAAAGFRVAAPDTRGVGETSRPTRVEDYRLRILGDDVAALIKALGAEKAHVIGHDWGGGIAWEAAMSHPAVVDRLAIVNAPLVPHMVRTMLTSPLQLLRSWYIGFFQLPRLPERFLTARHARSMLTMLAPGNFGDEEIGFYRDAICRPGAAWAGLAYYRAVVRWLASDLRRLRGKKVLSPTLVIWGERDYSLGKELTRGLDRYVRGPLRIEYLPESGHFVVEGFPDRFVELVVGFLKEGQGL